MPNVPVPVQGDARVRSTIDRLVLSVAEAAELLGVSRSCAYNLVACGDLAAVRVGRRLLVRCDAVYDYLDRHVVEVPTSVGS
jgi:excisionase family DNA binding protein